LEQGAITIADWPRHVLRSAEVEQRNPPVVEQSVVGVVGVGLHHREVEQLAEDKADDAGHRKVALILRSVVESFDWAAFDVAHGEHARGGEASLQGRHNEFGRSLQEVAVAAQLRAFAYVIGLTRQLRLGLGEKGRDVELGRKQARQRNSEATLSTSASMLSATPGYCTLIASRRPSWVSAR
jgi:hypothetical protein